MNKYIKMLQVPFIWLMLLLCIGTAAHAADIAAPVVLVATDRLAGSPYEETVVLAVPAGDGQHMGLIVNRPTDIELTTVFPGFTPSQKAADPVFFGGPAMSGALFAAIRATVPPSDYSVSLMPGLFLVTDKDTIDRLVKTTPNAARYFTGYVVWDQNELADEISKGMWDIQPAEANVLFRTDPQQLWIDLARNKRRVAAN